MRRRTKINGVLACVGFAGGAVAAILFVREPMEPLTDQALRAAEWRWGEAGLTSYDLSYRMHGSRYEVEVRDGVVRRARIDGRAPIGADPRNYSVEGLFATLTMELDNLHDPTGPFAGRRDSIVARVRFHPEFGYVERYLRSSGGAGRGAAIELIDFVPVGQ